MHLHRFGTEVMPKMDTIPEPTRNHASCIAGHDVDDLKKNQFSWATTSSEIW